MTEATRAPEYDADLLVLGASFCGIELLRLLRKHRRGRALDIIVIDRQRSHPYIPLGHELLTQRMAHAIASDMELETSRYAVAGLGVRWVEAELVGFDPDTHRAKLADGRRFSARFVVFGLGSEVRAPASLPGGERMLTYKSKAQFERAQAALQRVLVGDHGQGEPPNVVVVGGGISGVEIAGELAHLSVTRPPGWRAPKVVLVHGGDRLLPGLTPHAGHHAEAALRAQGVELLLNTRLVSIREDLATIRGLQPDCGGSERTIACALGFWAGGLQPPAVLAELGLPRTVEGWLRVGPTLQCVSSSTARPELFAGGDVARVFGGEGRWPTMQRAIEGIFAAKTIAANILTLARHPSNYPNGVPPLRPHTLTSDFPHGVSLGERSLIVFGRLVFPLARFNIWFRRFLMRQYMRRYRA